MCTVELNRANRADIFAAPFRLINAFGTTGRVDGKLVVRVYEYGVIRAPPKASAARNALARDSNRHAFGLLPCL